MELIVIRYLLKSVRKWFFERRRSFSPGYIWAPYVPLQVTPTIFKPSDFAPRKGIMTRYSKKKLQTSYYGTINVVSGKKKK